MLSQAMYIVRLCVSCQSMFTRRYLFAILTGLRAEIFQTLQSSITRSYTSLFIYFCESDRF